jgi:hypothetical protein
MREDARHGQKSKDATSRKLALLILFATAIALLEPAGTRASVEEGHWK